MKVVLTKEMVDSVDVTEEMEVVELMSILFNSKINMKETEEDLKVGKICNNLLEYNDVEPEDVIYNKRLKF